MAEAAPADSAAPVFRTIDELAEQCGHYCWLEESLFALMGERASAPVDSGKPAGNRDVDPEVRVLLSTLSLRRAALAAQWRRRLPVRAGVDAAALVVPSPGLEADALARLRAEPDLLVVLRGAVGEVLPWLLRAYRTHLAEASPVSEAPVRATLEGAAAMTQADIDRADRLLRRLGHEAHSGH